MSDAAMTPTALSALQVEMDPVRLAVACMALSLQNAALKEENQMFTQALQEIHTEAARIWQAGAQLPDCGLIADLSGAVLLKEKEEVSSDD